MIAFIHSQQHIGVQIKQTDKQTCIQINTHTDWDRDQKAILFPSWAQLLCQLLYTPCWAPFFGDSWWLSGVMYKLPNRCRTSILCHNTNVSQLYHLWRRSRPITRDTLNNISNNTNTYRFPSSKFAPSPFAGRRLSYERFCQRWLPDERPLISRRTSRQLIKRQRRIEIIKTHSLNEDLIDLVNQGTRYYRPTVASFDEYNYSIRVQFVPTENQPLFLCSNARSVTLNKLTREEIHNLYLVCIAYI